MKTFAAIILMAIVGASQAAVTDRSDCDENNPIYIGCYTDDANRDLQDGPMAYGYDQSSCNKACKDYKFFALQHNGWCVCGDAYATEAKYLKKPDSECGGKGMGAGWRNSIYNTCRIGCDENNPTYIGCYTDDSSRDLQNGPMAYGYNQFTCNKACKGYKYFALQHNGWCVCGDAYATEAKYVKKADSECGGNGLGGGWRNSIYQTCRDVPADPCAGLQDVGVPSDSVCKTNYPDCASVAHACNNTWGTCSKTNGKTAIRDSCKLTCCKND